MGAAAVPPERPRSSLVDVFRGDIPLVQSTFDLDMTACVTDAVERLRRAPNLQAELEQLPREHPARTSPDDAPELWLAALLDSDSPVNPIEVISGDAAPGPALAAIDRLHTELEQHLNYDCAELLTTLRFAVETDQRLKRAQTARDQLAGIFQCDMLRRQTNPAERPPASTVSARTSAAVRRTWRGIGDLDPWRTIKWRDILTEDVGTLSDDDAGVLASDARQARDALVKWIDSRRSELKAEIEDLVAPDGRASEAHQQVLTERENLDRTIESQIVARVRELLDRVLGRAYEPVLTPAKATTTRSAGAAYTPLRTLIYDDVEALIRNDVRSIGVSGPRGSGKTTLIQHLCTTHGRATAGQRDTAGESQLGFLVSAPTAYEPRDFILHLHRELCAAILGTYRLSRTPAAARPEIPTPRWVRPIPPQSLAPIGLAALAAATTLMAVTLISAGLPWPAPALLLLASGVALVATAWIVWMSTDYLRRLPSISPQSRQKFAGDANLRLGHIGMVSACLVGIAGAAGTVIGVSTVGLARTAPLLISGALILIGCLAALLWDGARWLRIRQRFDVPPGDERGAPAGDHATEPPASPPGSLLGNADAHPGLKSSPELEELARDQLELLDFQISYTADTSASMKVGATANVPVGGEAKSGSGTSWTASVRSYPQIVAAFRRLLEQVVATGLSVRIGIDELDKMQSSDDVQLFLNELKGVFGVPRTHFLVSVSEDAAAGFERRGSPFRDVFDSAFNDVVSISYLQLDDSRRLIVNEFGRWTEPFVALCHIHSGGLPRDLLRVARTILGYRTADEATLTITDACTRLTESDIGARLTAVRYMLRRGATEQSALDLLARLDEVDCRRSDPAGLRHEADRLTVWLSRQPRRGHTDPRPGDPVRELGFEVAATLAMAARISDLLSESYTEERLRAAMTPGGLIEQLASLRRALTVNPQLVLVLSLVEATGRKRTSTV